MGNSFSTTDLMTLSELADEIGVSYADIHYLIKHDKISPLVAIGKRTFTIRPSVMINYEKNGSKFRKWVSNGRKSSANSTLLPSSI